MQNSEDEILRTRQRTVSLLAEKEAELDSLRVQCRQLADLQLSFNNPSPTSLSAVALGYVNICKYSYSTLVKSTNSYSDEYTEYEYVLYRLLFYCTCRVQLQIRVYSIAATLSQCMWVPRAPE